MARRRRYPSFLETINPAVFDILIPAVALFLFLGGYLLVSRLPNGYWQMITSRPMRMAVKDNTIRFSETYNSVSTDMQFFKMTFRFTNVNDAVGFNISYSMETRGSGSIIARRRERHFNQEIDLAVGNSSNYNLFCDRILAHETISVEGQINCTDYPRGIFLLEVVYINPPFAVFLDLMKSIASILFFLFTIINAIPFYNSQLGRRLFLLGMSISVMHLPFFIRHYLMPMRVMHYFDLLTKDAFLGLVFFTVLTLYQQMTPATHVIKEAVIAIIGMSVVVFIEMQCMSRCLSRYRDYFDEIRTERLIPVGIVFSVFVLLFVFNAIVTYRKVGHQSRYEFWYLTVIGISILAIFGPYFVAGLPTDFRRAVLFPTFLSVYCYLILVFIEQRKYRTVGKWRSLGEAHR